MKMEAGKKLCRRKPRVVPARMAARIPASGLPMDMAMMAKVPAATDMYCMERARQLEGIILGRKMPRGDAVAHG